MAIEDLQTKKDLERFVQNILDQPGAVKQPAVQGLPDALGIRGTDQIVYGRIDTSVSSGSGTGFTWTRNGTGDVTITFSTAFSAVPSVVPWPAIAGLVNVVPTMTAPSTTSVRIGIIRRDTGANIDSIVNFIAIGARA